jgi:hypothetical protein
LVAADTSPETTPPILPQDAGTLTALHPPLRPAPNETYGDFFATKKKDSFRVWSVNANGISSKNDFAELHSMCVSLKTREVDAIAIQDENTDFMQADLRGAYTTIFKEHFGQTRVLMATTCIQAPRAWKPGGVVLAILGPWAQHVSKVSCNDLGRWVSATLTGSDGDSFTLFSLYNVEDTKLQDAGRSTVFAQQYRLLRIGGVTHPNPRKQCIEDLQRVIAQLVANEERVVVVGDPGLVASVCAAVGRQGIKRKLKIVDSE